MNRKYCLWSLLLVMIFSSCEQKKKQVRLKAVFDLGEVHFIHTVKPRDSGYELTLMSRFFINSKKMNPELNTYFQYELGNRIRLVIGADTLKPVLSYYVPLIKEEEKEIDCKFLLDKKDIEKNKQIIISDTLLGFEKIKLAFK